MLVEDLLAVHSPNQAALCRYLRTRSDVATVETLADGWLVARGHPRGAAAGRETPPKEPSDGLRVIAGPSELLQAGPGRQRFVRLLRSQPSSLAQFSGDFTAVLLEPQGRVSFVRSCSGTTPLYVASDSEFVAVGTRVDWVALSLPWPLRPDWLPIAVYAAGWASFPYQRSQIRGVTRVALGHAGSGAVGAPLRTERYWYPEHSSPRTRLTLDEAAHELRELLTIQLTRGLGRDGTNLVLFSGGVDSACLTALAHTLGYPLQAVSLNPPPTTVAYARENHFLDGLAKCFNRHHRVDGDSSRLLELSRATAHVQLPVVGGWAALNDWRGRPAGGSVLTGWFADECWGIHRLGDWRHSASLSELPNLLSRTQHPLRTLLRRAGLRASHELSPPERLPLPFPSELDEEYRAWRSETLSASDVPRRVRHLTRCRQVSDYGGVHAEFAAKLGYLAVIPCSSREVVEHAYQLPPRLCFDRRLTKLPLRRAVPEVDPLYAWRRDKGGWHTSVSGFPPSAHVKQEPLQPLLREWVDKTTRTSHDAPAEDVLLKAAIGNWVLRWMDDLEHERAQLEHS